MASSSAKVATTWGQMINFLYSDREKWNSFIRSQPEFLNAELSPTEVVLTSSNPKCKVKKLGKWEKIPSYEELDTRNFLKLLKQNYNKYMDDHLLRTLYFSNGKGTTIKYSNKERLINDISLLIVTAATSWNNLQFRDEISLVVKWLKTKYCIHTTVRSAGSSLAPTAVTITRLAACFPSKICDYFHEGFGNPPFTFSDIGVESQNKLSRALLCTYMPALIPCGWIKDSSPVHFLFFLVHVLTDDAMHRDDKKFTDLDTMLTCYTASYKYTGTPEAIREKWMTKRGLGDSVAKTFNSVLVTAAVVCEGYIKIQRANDKTLEKVLNDLKYLK